MAGNKSSIQELSRVGILQEVRPYQAVSMRKLAEKLGCSHGTIYYQFKNKAQTILYNY